MLAGDRPWVGTGLVAVTFHCKPILSRNEWIKTTNGVFLLPCLWAGGALLLARATLLTSMELILCLGAAGGSAGHE